jgi:HK97 family phage portal protein
MLIEKLLSTNKKIDDNPINPRPEYEPSWGYKTESGERVSVEASKAIATAYRAKNIISDDVAKMPLQQMRRVGRNIEQVEPDPVTRNNAYLLQISPNMWGWTPFQFKKLVIEWQLFYGNAYIWAPIIGPRQFLILPANRTMPVFDLDGNLWYQHTFSNSNKPVYIPGVEILQLLINPDESGFIGRSMISYARETFGRRIAAGKTLAKEFSKGFMPAAIVTMAGEVNAEARKKVRNEYEEQMSGTENAYRLAVMDPKITKFEPVTLQLRDQQFLELIGATDTDICNFFGLPSYKLNQGKQTYESNEQQNLDYLNTTLDAYLVPWEEGAHIRWLTNAEQGSNYFKFVRESLLRMSAKARAEVYKDRIMNGTMTPNEALEKEDMNGYPEGDRHYMQSTVMAIEGPTQNDNGFKPIVQKGD